jgi:hypothetical protein
VLNHVRRPELDRLVSDKHKFNVHYDPRKRRYYLYTKGRICIELSFTEREFRSAGYRDRLISRWMSGMERKHRHPEDIDFEYMDKQAEEKAADERDRITSFIANEFVKYGVKGSQAPGPSSIVVGEVPK